MLFLAERLLKATGFEYDAIEETWVVPVPLRPVVTVECDEDGPYVMEALLKFTPSCKPTAARTPTFPSMVAISPSSA